MPGVGYEIVKSERSGLTGIRCLNCGAISYNANDVENLYCGRCHRFHNEPNGHSDTIDGSTVNARRLA